MNLVKLINWLEEIRAEYGNLPEIYIHLGFTGHPEWSFLEELSNIEVEERRTLFLIAEAQLQKEGSKTALDLVELIVEQQRLLDQQLKEWPELPVDKQIRQKMARITGSALRIIKANLELAPRSRPVLDPEKIRTGQELNDRAALIRRAWREVTEKAPDIMEDMKGDWMTELETLYWTLGYHERQAQDMARAAFGEEPIDRDA